MEILRQYRPFFIFLFKFFGVYGLLAIVYHFYLLQFDAHDFEVDGFTVLVAEQAQWVASLFGYTASLVKHGLQPAVKFILDGKYVSRVVEGCNGVSVIILFAAFVVAFTGKWKRTLVFILCGALVIHLLNIMRIALLSIALLHFPEHEHVLHGVIFPAVIYGVVFLLWVTWVNKYSTYAG